MTGTSRLALATLVSVGLAAPAVAAEPAGGRVAPAPAGLDLTSNTVAADAASSPAPVVLEDQARPRPAGSSSSGSSSSGSSSGSTGSSAGSSSSGVSSGSSGQARPRPAGSASRGSAVSRTPPPSGGSSGASARPGGSTASTGSRTAATRGGGGVSTGRSAVVSTGRDRNGRPITGNAVRRDVAGVYPPFFGPWGRWFPYYGTGWGPSFGFVVFNPYGIWGGSYWNWYRGGYWYDPWPYGWYSGWGYGGSAAPSSRHDDGRRVGSIRLKASPSTAKVYIDGALVGTVDDFNGLSGHLQLDEGVYQLELRADGYRPYSGELEVKAGKTLTERVKLKKID